MSTASCTAAAPNRAPLMLFGGHSFLPLACGALWWEQEATLIVADLHFGKGRWLASCGHPLPLHDTLHSLQSLQALCEAHQPRRVLCLGDNFHNDAAFNRMSPEERRLLHQLQQGVEWRWLAGNHDPHPPGCGGIWQEEWHHRGLHFLHQAEESAEGFRLCGHYHPRFRGAVGGRRFYAPGFVEDGRLLILPSFGAYTGGLDVADPVIAKLFPQGYRVHLCWRNRVYRILPSALA